MSLTYLSNNIFRFQEVDENSIIYKSTNSSFATIQTSQGVLMCNIDNTLSFGIPTAAELVENYTGKSIVMTSANKLVEVPVTGSSPNKLLRLVDGAWQVVDFSVEYIKPELYDPSSWQLWIADDEINVINIPKEDINDNYWGVRYNQDTNTFNVVNSTTFNPNISEIYIKYSSNNIFPDVYNKAIIYSNINSNSESMFTCLYSSDKTKLFGGILTDYIADYNFPHVSFNRMTKMFIYGGLYIKNYNEYTPNARTVVKITDSNDNTLLIYSSFNSLNNIDNCIQFNNSAIIPIEYYIPLDYLSTDNFNVYIMYLKQNENDNSEFHWYFPRGYLNLYIDS